MRFLLILLMVVQAMGQPWRAMVVLDKTTVPAIVFDPGIKTIVTSSTTTPTVTSVTATGTGLRVWTGETPVAEESFLLYVTSNSVALPPVKLYRWQGRILNCATGDRLAFGTSDGRTVQAASMQVPIMLNTSFPVSGTANCDKAGVPLWSPANAHITLPGASSSFQIASGQQERIVFISEFDGSQWSYPRWVWTQTNANVSIQCNYTQVALANYDGATLEVNCPTGSTISGMSNYMTLPAMTVTGQTRNVTTVSELVTQMAVAVAGDEIVMAPGTYTMAVKLQSSLFTANVAAGRKGAEGITIRGSTGDRADVILTGNNTSMTSSGANGGIDLYQLGATAYTWFKNLTIVTTSLAYDIHFVGKFRFQNIRVFGQQLNWDGYANCGFICGDYTDGTSSNYDFLWSEFSTSHGDNFNAGYCPNVRMIGCRVIAAGNPSNPVLHGADQNLSSHKGGSIQAYGTFLSDAPKYSGNDSGFGSFNYLFFCDTDPGSRNELNSIASTSVFGSRIRFNTAGSYTTTETSCYFTGNRVENTHATGVTFDYACPVPIKRNRFILASGAVVSCSNGASQQHQTNFTGNISIGGGRNVNPFYGQYNHAGPNAYHSPLYYFNNTCYNGVSAGIRIEAAGADTPNSCVTNNASLALNGFGAATYDATAKAAVQENYNVFSGTMSSPLWTVGGSTILGNAAFNTATFIPTPGGNCDGTGDASLYSFVGDIDPYGFVFIYKSGRVSRGAREIPAIYAGATLFPDLW